MQLEKLSLRKLYGGTDNTPLRIELYWKERLEFEFQTAIKLKEMDYKESVEERRIQDGQRRTP